MRRTQAMLDAANREAERLNNLVHQQELPIMSEEPEIEEGGYDPIPETCKEALAMWDAGRTVFSVEMGYEMAIQGLAFELIRVFADLKWEDYNDEESWEQLEEIANPVIHSCNMLPWGGFSGAQVGSAQNFAACVCRRGYRVALRDEKDRLIQVCKQDLRTQRVEPQL